MRELPSGCGACGLSLNYCDCVRYIDAAACCNACTHRN